MKKVEIENQIEENELVKHTGIIHISNTLSLAERKIVNILLKNAYDNLETKKLHEIKISDLQKIIGRRGNNDEEIKKSLRNIMSYEIEANIFGKDKKNTESWINTRLLAGVMLTKKSGYCIYEYPHLLISLLKSPNIYARLDLNIQKNFRSKHSIALWEYFMEILSVRKKDEVNTSWLTIEDFKKLLALGDSKYKEFKHLNHLIIKPTINEINKVSNIEVEVFLQKQGKVVTALSFFIKRKQKTEIKPFEEDLEDARKMRDVTNSSKVLKTSNPAIFNTLTEYYLVSDQVAIKLIEEYPEEQIEQNLEYVKKHNEEANIKNLGAFTVKAIRENYIIKENKLEKEKVLKEEREWEEKTSKIKEKYKVDNENILWKKVKGMIELKFEEFELQKYSNWLSKIDFIKIEGDDALFLIKEERVNDNKDDKFLRDMIMNDFGKNILQFFTILNDNIKNISMASPRDYIFTKLNKSVKKESLSSDHGKDWKVPSFL